MKLKWPLMLVSTHERVRLENYTLRDALREANRELLKHRQLIAALKSGHEQTSKQFEAAVRAK